MTQPFNRLERHAALSAGRLAIAGTGVRLTYGDLFENVGKVAARLRALGVKPGHTIALALPAQLEAVFALAAFHEAAISCTLPAALDIPAKLGFDWVFATEARASSIGPGAASVVTIDGAWLRATSTVNRVPKAREYGDDDVCRLLFSSGTTGSPKAVAFTVEGAERRAASAAEHWMGVAPLMSLLGLSTASGFLAFYRAMATGHTFFIPGLPAENLALMREFDIASIKASPIQLDALVRAMSPLPTVLPRLKRIQSAGGFLPKGLAERLMKTFACEVVNLYGSSEVGTVSLRTGALSEPQDVGLVVSDVELQIVDEGASPVPAGSVGRVRYQRPGQVSGYFRDQEASSDHFIDGWFYPGARGSLTGDGRLRIEGRASEVMNAAGAKVDPIVLETQALGYDGINDAAAFMAGSEDGVDRIGLAFVSDDEPDVEDLAQYLRHRLGGSAPLVYVRLPSIPRNEMGKVLRRDLGATYESLGV